jgi:hypothetical protein
MTNNQQCNQLTNYKMNNFYTSVQGNSSLLKQHSSCKYISDDQTVNGTKSITEIYGSNINRAVVGFQTYLTTRAVIPMYNQKGPEIREKLLCCAYCNNFPQYLPYDY